MPFLPPSQQRQSTEGNKQEKVQFTINGKEYIGHVWKDKFMNEEVTLSMGMKRTGNGRATVIIGHRVIDVSSDDAAQLALDRQQQRSCIALCIRLREVCVDYCAVLALAVSHSLSFTLQC